MAENAKQEFELELGGKTYSVRPSFTVLAAIEGATDQPCRTLGIKCMAVGSPQAFRGEVKEISVVEMATIIFHMIRDQKDAPKNMFEVGDLLVEEGYADLILPVGQFLTQAQKGNREHEKEAAKTTANPQKAAA